MQADLCDFKTSLVYTGLPCLKKQNNQKVAGSWVRHKSLILALRRQRQAFVVLRSEFLDSQGTEKSCLKYSKAGL